MSLLSRLLGVRRASPNAFELAGAIFIDPQNVTTTASNGNSGTSAGQALFSYTELARRWGTYGPRLRQSTTLTFLSSHVDDSDPVYWYPYQEAGAQPILQGVLGNAQIVAQGQLAGVVAKNTATGQLLNATLGAGVGPGTIVVNTTLGKSSRAFVYKNVAGNTWALSQPLVPTNIAAFVQTPAEVNSWANTDTYVAYNPVQVNVARLAGNLVDFNGGFNNQLALYQLGTFSDGGGNDPLNVHGQFNIAECSLSRIFEMSDNGQAIGPAFVNVDFASAGTHLRGGSAVGTGQPVVVSGGQFRGFGADLWAPTLQLDVIIGATVNVKNEAGYGSVFIDTGKVLTFRNLTEPLALVHLFWGAGTLSGEGRARICYTGNAVATFLQSAFSLNGLTTAYAVGTGAAAVWNGSISITAAHLDAAFGVAGFGGTAIVPGGATITNQAS